MTTILLAAHQLAAAPSLAFDPAMPKLTSGLQLLVAGAVNLLIGWMALGPIARKHWLSLIPIGAAAIGANLLIFDPIIFRDIAQWLANAADPNQGGTGQGG